MIEQRISVVWRRRHDRRSLWRLLSPNRDTSEGDQDGKYKPAGEKSSGGDQGQRNVSERRKNSSCKLGTEGDRQGGGGC